MKDTQSTIKRIPLLGARKRKQRGALTMQETALVLLIGALFLAGGYALVITALSNYRANKITDEFNLAIPAIQTAYQNRTSYAGLTTAQVALNGWVGSGITEYAGGTPTGSLITQWGTLTFEPASNGTQARATLNNVPSRECVKIATAFSGDQFLSATVNGGAVKSGVNDLDLTAVGTQCNASDTNTITFNFGRA
ncbi:type 4 pilus major pilin [Pseudomonas guariconensis]|uniref:type 4 pilus major pilin n=1 Tax=Pseudomonas guariconensis TaxID=1288410 RepID=UPI003EE198EF